MDFIFNCVTALGILSTFCDALMKIDLRVRLNHDAKLHCRVQGSGEVTVQWYGKKSGLLSEGTIIYQHHGTLSIDKPAPDEWILIIHKVTPSFADDIYTCKTNRNTAIFEVTLNLETPPKIDESKSSPEHVNFTENEDAEVTCVAIGEPKPTITWFRRSLENPIGITGQKLIFKNITRYATDDYICRAKNEINQIERRITVNVNFKPDVTVMEQEVFAEHTDSVNLSCAVQASPLSDAYWVQGTNLDGNGTPLKPNWNYNVHVEEAGEGIPIKFITLNINRNKADMKGHDFFGNYTCVAKGNEHQAQAQVELKQKRRR